MFTLPKILRKMEEKVNIIVWDFSNTLVFAKDINYRGGLNKLYSKEEDKSFSQLFHINTELFRFIDSIKEKIPSAIFTAGNMQNDGEIFEILDNLFVDIETTEIIGSPKNDPKAYEKICKTYHSKPEQVIFIDDLERNVNAAKQAGLKTIQYKGDNQEIIQFIKRYVK